MFDKLRSMEVLVAVADAGSFAAAGRELNLTPAMVGRHVQAMETHLGMRLIQRSTRRQSLTQVGREFVQDCRRVLEQVRWAETVAERNRQVPQGLLRVSVSMTLGQCVIAPLVTQFLKTHSQVCVDLHLSDGLVDLVGEMFDAAIRVGAVHDENLVARPLRPYRMVIAAAPVYLKRHGIPRRAEDLAQHTCLSHSVWQRRSEWTLHDGDRAVLWPETARLSVNHGDSLRDAAVAGLGLIMQPEVLLANDLAAGRLQQVLAECSPPERAVYLVYPSDRQRLPKVSAFIDCVLAHWGLSTN